MNTLQYTSNLQRHVFVNSYLQTFNQTAAPDENALTSPIGFLLLLTTLLGAGAPAGNTLRQMGDTLKLSHGQPEERYSQATDLFHNVYDSLVDEDNVNVALSVFVQQHYNIKCSFETRLQDNFNVTLEQVDFNDGQQCMEKINDWINEKSHGLIPELINSAAEINPETGLMALNVLAFKDNWKRHFVQVHQGHFYKSAISRIRVPMMHVEERLPYVDVPEMGFMAIKKPLRNKRFSVIIALPTTPFDFEALNHFLFATPSFKQLFKKSEGSSDVHLAMPKFDLHLKQKLEAIASDMGMPDMFGKGIANFSGITDSEQLYIDKMEQASTLRVDKNGVEAAVATHATVVPRSAFHTEVEFIVNHPFGFIIHDEKLDTPLLVARVVDPEQ